jgi:hypothetical protein
MARLRVIDLELADSQVETVLDRFFPAAAGGEGRAVVEVRPALAAPAGVQEVELEPVAAAPVPPMRTKMRRAMHVPHEPAGAAPVKPIGIAERILFALPGEVDLIARRSKLTPQQCRQNLYLLKKNGKVGVADGVWSQVNGAAAAPKGKPGRKPAAKTEAQAEAPPANPKTTAEVFHESLAGGPFSTKALFDDAVRAGKPVPDVHHAERILQQMERRGEVAQYEAGLWKLVKE